MNEAFVILDMANSQNWDTFLRLEKEALCCQRIPAEDRSTILHPSRAIAEAEALRLQRAHPKGFFVIFTAIAATQLVEAATHVNLAGHVLRTESHARLVSVDEVPL